MATSDGVPPQPRFEVKADSNSHFAWLRTRLGVERTFLAWVRTAVALIGFGFTIVQFFERFSDMSGIKGAARPEAPRYLGLALIAVGTVALLISMWQYRQLQSYLWGGNLRVLAGVSEAGPRPSSAYLVAVALFFVGIFAFFAVLTRSL